MSDDFLRLVSQSNPATRQYQPASNGYPPSAAAGPYSDHSPQLMDPFFDDEDDNMPDSAFGRPAPMQSQESGLPLARAAAPPAGTGPSSSSNGLPQGWNFDDDDFQPANGQTFPGPSSHSTPKKPKSSAISRFKSRKWKWPWQKEQVLTGERVIALNNSAANADFCSNFVSTSKYNMATFIPKFLFGMHFCWISQVSFLTFYRTILKIRQPVFPVYRIHSTNSWGITDEQVYYNCAIGSGVIGLGVQRSARGSG